MRPPDLPRLFDAVDKTWPAAVFVEAGPWLLREGRGGGKRVSATTARGTWRQDDIAAAEKAMRLMGQAPLFMVRPGDEALDQLLAQDDYDIVDPVNLWLCPARQLTDRRLPPVTAFTIWEPLAIMREIWESGGISGARQNVMERVSGPKTSVFGRLSDQPAGAGFAAIHDGIAMVHALEILPSHRGKGLGRWMMRAVAFWAVQQGAEWLTVLCTTENAAANALYKSLGMQQVGGYHYRVLADVDQEDRETETE